MKKLIGVLVLSILFCLSTSAATYLDVWLSWTYNTSPTNLVNSFVVYYARDGSANFQAAVTVPATTNAAMVRVPITTGVTKQLSFKIKAKNAVGESDFSNSDSIPKATPTNAPADLTIFNTTVTVGP
jgi:hypothetical protein